MLFFFIPRIFQRICNHFDKLHSILGGNDH